MPPLAHAPLHEASVHRAAALDPRAAISVEPALLGDEQDGYAARFHPAAEAETPVDAPDRTDAPLSLPSILARPLPAWKVVLPGIGYGSAHGGHRVASFGGEGPAKAAICTRGADHGTVAMFRLKPP